MPLVLLVTAKAVSLVLLLIRIVVAAIRSWWVLNVSYAMLPALLVTMRAV